jgi:hypothetical protein
MSKAGSTLPDFEYEYHTVAVDTIGQSSKNKFSVYLANTLENVVQAKLLAARIDTSGTNVCHVSIDQLDSNYSQRATSTFNGQGSMSMINKSFGSLIQNGSNPITFRDSYDIEREYATPIRKLDRLDISLLKQDGAAITNGGGENVFIFRFACKKKNMPFTN